MFIILCPSPYISAENEKGVNAAQQSSVENQKGVIAIGIVQW